MWSILCKRTFRGSVPAYSLVCWRDCLHANSRHSMSSTSAGKQRPLASQGVKPTRHKAPQSITSTCRALCPIHRGGKGHPSVWVDIARQHHVLPAPASRRPTPSSTHGQAISGKREPRWSVEVACEDEGGSWSVCLQLPCPRIHLLPRPTRCQLNDGEPTHACAHSHTARAGCTHPSLASMLWRKRLVRQVSVHHPHQPPTTLVLFPRCTV